MPKWLEPVGVAVFLAVLVAWSAWNRWAFLDASPYPVGVDGYFYAVQVRSVLETGGLHYPASPMAFYLLAPFAALTDPVTGAKLGAAVLGALVAVPAYFVGKRLGGSRGAGLVAASLATTSAGSFYLSVEFIKNGVGMTVALTYAWMLLRALERPTRGRIGAAAAALVVTFATHKLAAGLALVVTIPPIVVEVRRRAGDRRRIALAAAISAGALAALAAVLALAFPGRFLGAREVGLATHVYGGEARWDLPALAGPHELWLGHEAALGGALALGLAGALAAWWRLPRARQDHPIAPASLAMAIALGVIAIAVALPWLDVGNPSGLGFRLRIAAFVPMALVAAAALGTASSLVPRDLRTPLLASAAMIWAFAQPRSRDEGVVHAHPAMVTAVRAMAKEIPAGAAVICPERHILYMVSWYARVETHLRPEDIPEDRRWRLVPLAFVGDRSPLDRALIAARDLPDPPRGTHPRHPNGLVLVSEPTWRWVLDQLPAPTRRRAERWRIL